MKYGVDIAVRRADDLDKMMIETVIHYQGSSILDIGSGEGGQSIRLAKAGGCVTAIDIGDYLKEFSNLKSVHSLDESSISFIQGDVRNISDLLNNKIFDYCCMQRVIHYLKYEEALKLLKCLKAHTTKQLFISASGLESEIGRHYEDKSKSVESRFCKLNEDSAQKFHITEPICLYTQPEFEKLLKEAGWSIKKSWVSAFGNIKVVCE